MSLYINTNSSAAYASFHLGKNNKSLHESLVRLSSGKRINNPGDDSGGLAVSMKLSSSINRLNDAERNLQNAISFKLLFSIYNSIYSLIYLSNENI